MSKTGSINKEFQERERGRQQRSKHMHQIKQTRTKRLSCQASLRREHLSSEFWCTRTVARPMVGVTRVSEEESHVMRGRTGKGFVCEREPELDHTTRSIPS
jgi:hypothetical protein